MFYKQLSADIKMYNYNNNKKRDAEVTGQNTSFNVIIVNFYIRRKLDIILCYT